MNVHKQARTLPASRALLVERVHRGRRVAQVAAELGVSARTAYKWLARHRSQGAEGLHDRRSRPHRIPRRTDAHRESVVLRLRRLGMTGPAIARKLRMPRSTVAAVLKRAGLARLRDLVPRPPDNRYVRTRPGSLVHLDTKKLGRFSRAGHRVTGDRHGQSNHRGIGWEFVHLAIDDASRLAYVEVLADERGPAVAGFLRRAAAFFARHGIRRIEQVMTDNGSGYISLRFAEALRELGAEHLRTRPYTPRTNGKAERLVQTLLREWAYVRRYETSSERKAALPRWLRHYNRSRPHGSLEGRAPERALKQLLRVNNLAGNHI